MSASLYGRSEESKSIWVYLEQEGDSFESVSLELLARGREMANQMNWRLVGLILGHQISHLGKLAIAHGVDEVRVADHPFLNLFTIEAYARVVFQAVMASRPSVFLLGATPNGRDLAGRLAVRFRTGLNADCTDLRLDPESGVLVSEVSGFGGGVLALIEMQQHRPQMATVRPGVFSLRESESGRKGDVIHVPVDLTEDMLRTHVLERVIGGTVDLSRVPMLVIGGRGINGDFETLRQLANLIGGDVGATRPPVDDGHIERERQVGQTGVICSPKVALCCGLSGAFHLVVGIEKADLVIAINSDPEAPIFEFADYCIVGDVRQYLPALVAALRMKGEATHA